MSTLMCGDARSPVNQVVPLVQALLVCLIALADDGTESIDAYSILACPSKSLRVVLAHHGKVGYGGSNRSRGVQ